MLIRRNVIIENKHVQSVILLGQGTVSSPCGITHSQFRNGWAVFLGCSRGGTSCVCICYKFLCFHVTLQGCHFFISNRGGIVQGDMKLAKAYEPHKYEEKIYKLWEKAGAFTPINRGNDGAFSVVVPPPNANGDLHIGHGLNMAIMDVLARYHRMTGEATLFLPGADHAGFETWVVYEKQLNAQGKSRFDFSREDLYKQIWDFVAENKESFRSQFRRLGASVDWDSYVYTLDSKIVDQAYRTFQKMWDEGLIYRAEKLVNFCTFHGTGFADIEVAYKDTPGHLWHIRYPLTDGSGAIVVATTRPETMLGDTAVAVHPDDKRYKKFVGKTVTLPLTGREVPVIADDYVDMEYGTGAVKITPAHDVNDYAMAERHSLPMISVIDHRGTLTSEVPKAFVGLTTEEARKAVVAALESAGSLDATENITHSVGHCYKCGTVLEPLLREQWFVDMKPLAEKALTVLKKDKISFHPESKKQQLITYLEGLRDWNISRQIAWGIPVPAFQNVDQPDDWIFDTAVDQETISKNGKTYRRDPDVFDTWFSSASWPYATLDAPDGDFFKQFYPLSVMETGADILYPWVSRMIMFGLYNTGTIPFKDVYLHGLIQDEHGQKMSKSKGNVVNPMEKIEQFGSDAFRMGILMGESAGNNRPYNEPKVVGGRNFCNKLWNIARFVDDLVGKGTAKPLVDSAADAWLLSKLQHIIREVGEGIAQYRFSEALDQLYHFVWDDFADWYIEASKSQPNAELLRYSLETILKLCHPFAPFVTEAIWQELKLGKELLITSSWPEAPGGNIDQAKEFEALRSIISESRTLVSAMKLTKPTLLHQSELVAEHAAIIARMARIGAVEQVKQGRGFQLTGTREKVWLDVSDEALAKYRDSIHKQLVETEEQGERLQQRLANKGYVASAPEKIVQQTRDQLKELENKAAQLQAELKRFK